MDLGVRDLFTGSGGETAPEADGADRRVYHECRACGTALDSDRESCPACGGEVAGHVL